MCDSEVPIPVWILGLTAKASASAATSMSFSTDLVSPQTVVLFNILLNSDTDSKSPGLEIGNKVLCKLFYE